MSLGRAVAAFILLPGPGFPRSEKNMACPVFIAGQESFGVTVVDLHGRVIIMLYYFLAHFTLRTLQSLNFGGSSL